MGHLPKNFPEILRSYGLKVVEIPGWYGRGRPGSYNPKGGFLNHHTGSYDGKGDPANDLAYAKWLAIEGRSDLPAPLAQTAVSAEGVVYVLASGRANHAGKAKAFGSMGGGDGNALYTGTEAMNSGSQGWPKPQYDAMVLLNAVFNVRVSGNSHRTNNGHKETSTTGKWDPGMMDMAKFRKDVAAKMKAIKGGTTPKPTTPAPGSYDKMDPRSYFGGVKGPHVSWLMGRLIAHGIKTANGNTLTTKTTQWGPTAVAAVAAFQAKHKGWAVSGTPGPVTLKALAAAPPKQNRLFVSDVTVVVGNVKSTPLMKPSSAQADYERLFKAAKQTGAQSVMLNEYHSSYKSALFNTAKAHGYIVHEKGGLAVAYRDNNWDLSGVAYAMISKGVAHISPNRGVLRVGNETPGGTRVVFDATMFPRGWTNTKYDQYKVTRPMGVNLAKGIGQHVKNQTGNLKSAAIVGGDMNHTKVVDWKGLAGVSPAAHYIGKGDALDKMMQAYLFLPTGWTGKVVAADTIAMAYTDHNGIWVHFQTTRPV